MGPPVIRYRTPGVQRRFGASFNGRRKYSAHHLPKTPAIRSASRRATAVLAIDGSAFRALKPGVLFVNIGRGQTVDHDALLGALQSNHVSFAALDVTDPEPLPPDHPLWTLPNVLISPHSASTVARENARITQIFSHNLACWIEGRRQDMRNVLGTRLMY